MDRIESGGFFAYRREHHRRKGRVPDSDSDALRSAFLPMLDRPDEPVDAGIASGVGAPFDAPQSKEEITEMLDSIHTLGDRLIRRQTMMALKEYRAAVQRFLRVVAQGGVAVESRTSREHVINRKRFTILRVVDERLERLTTGILQSQREQLDLVAAVEEIYGMLVDLYH